jgi:hypothetical protein
MTTAILDHRVSEWHNATWPRFLSFLLLTCMGAVFSPGMEVQPGSSDAFKLMHPPRPESDGLRLEVTAELEDRITSDGKDSSWHSASFSVALALQNTSAGPITVPTTAYDEKPAIVPLGIGFERILMTIDSVKFQGKPTAFVPSRFTPVTLGPGERVLLWRHRVNVTDRKQADALKGVSAVFNVTRTFDGPEDWWRGNLVTYADIKRHLDPEKYISDAKASLERFYAQKAAERDPNYGKANAARVAALIASSDEARVRGEIEKQPAEVTVRDAEWIRQVSVAFAARSLPRSTHCFCIGWRTTYFYKGGQLVVSIAAIHGNQLRIHWPGGGGDYPIDEAHWQAVKQALEYPRSTGL